MPPPYANPPEESPPAQFLLSVQLVTVSEPPLLMAPPVPPDVFWLSVLFSIVRVSEFKMAPPTKPPSPAELLTKLPLIVQFVILRGPPLSIAPPPPTPTHG